MVLAGEARNSMAGQSSIEFLYATGLALIFFSVSMVIFYQTQNDAASLSAAADGRRVCNAIAAQISAVADAGDGASAELYVPQLAEEGNYTILVTGHNRSISVSRGSWGTGCLFSTSSVSNGTSDTFYIDYRNGTGIRNIGGGVLIG